ncbi:lichenicidin A2 family type 2 lantibiotic [Paenibacillus sp. IHBB 10380]|uniref:lichenicidin A2 family type 2 lantibiotic n=1 Tax=Paenibacillus sp. IHBB 10380 TaxID=1566358 RepID=UPI0005CFD1B0|nr:lichenicidin A2 family type 2 lantibiotic [Paenibacillus sp. IHBB 10380]
MSEINTKAIVGDTFEDMSLVEMTLVQGAGDVGVEATPTTIATPALSKAVSAIVSFVGTAIVSIAKC